MKRFILTQNREALLEHGIGMIQTRQMPGGWLLVKAHLTEQRLRTAQSDARLMVLPSLHTAAAKVNLVQLGRLNAFGVNPNTGDTVLDLLRSLRNKYIAEPERFDISDEV